jgi:hypothetical protein
MDWYKELSLGLSRKDNPIIVLQMPRSLPLATFRLIYRGFTPIVYIIGEIAKSLEDQSKYYN